jgi:hypothetical protein
MQSDMPKRSLRSRQFFRAFFAHRSWLLLLLLLGAGAGAALSLTQERVYLGRLELASAVEAAPTRVLLPDNARLWQLVYSAANLNLLTDGADDTSASFERVNRSIKLQPVSMQSTGSSVWSLSIEIPAANVATARERLDRYAARIDSEFRERVLLVRRQRPITPVAVRRTSADHTASRTAIIDQAIAKTAHSPEESAATPDANSPPLLPTKDQNKEVKSLAEELGVSVEQLPLVIDQFETSIDDRVTQLHDRESRIARAMESINRAESNPLSASIRSDSEAAHPELVSLRTRRQQLLAERARLATYLKPAHPEFQSLDRDLKDVESTLRQAQQAAVDGLRQDVTRWDAEVKSLRESIVEDRERLATVRAMIGLPATIPNDRSRAASTPPASNAVLATPYAAPAPTETVNPPTSATGDRPIGRVVVRPGVIDAEPLRPRTARNMLIGAAIGLLVYAFASVVRAGSDQRIHAVDDLESMDLKINVFGSIPKVRSGAPVKFSS